MGIEKTQTYIRCDNIKDLELRTRINLALDIRHRIPVSYSDKYPNRGIDIYRKVEAMVNSPLPNEELEIQSPLKEKEYLPNMLVVMCYWGTDTSRAKATKKAIERLTRMNPMPEVVFVEGSVDGKYRFDYITTVPHFSYVRVDLQNDIYRNLFMKETLWNYGVQVMLNEFEFDKICYLDADCAFVDQYSFKAISDALNIYDVISPMHAGYYSGSSSDTKKYRMLNTTGYYYDKKVDRAGWQGFGIAMTYNFLKGKLNLELPCSPLGFADCCLWYLLTGKSNMRNFKLIPYQKEKLEPYMIRGVKIGYADTVLMHIYHGSIVDRQYEVKCRLVQRCIQTPFSEFTRINNTSLLGWAKTKPVGCLRHCLENLLIFNRKEVKLTTAKDADQFFNWLMGLCPHPPDKFKKTRYALNHNKMPNIDVSMPIPNKYSEI